MIQDTDGKPAGDPRKAAERVVDIVRKEGMAADKETPLRLPLGLDTLERIGNKCLKGLKELGRLGGRSSSQVLMLTVSGNLSKKLILVILQVL